MRHILALPLTHASSSGALAASVHRVSQLHTDVPLVLAGDFDIWFQFFQLGRSLQVDAPLCPLCRRSCSLIPWCFGTPLIFPLTGPALDIILSTRSPRLRHCPLWLQLLFTCASLLLPLSSACHLDIPKASLLPNSAHSSLPRVRDWSTVVASCHHSLSVWHQSVLAHVSGPLPDFPARASTLDSLFGSLTQILFDCASLHSRRRLKSRPCTMQPLWWNDACCHALVARNGVTFVALAHMGIRLVSASCASFTAQSIPGPTSGTNGLGL